MSTTRLQEVLICFGKEEAGRHRHGAGRCRHVAIQQAERRAHQPETGDRKRRRGVRQGPRVPDRHLQDGVGRGHHAGEVPGRGDRRVGRCFGLGKVVKSGAARTPTPALR